MHVGPFPLLQSGDGAHLENQELELVGLFRMITFLDNLEKFEQLIEQPVTPVVEEKVPLEILVEPHRQHLQYTVYVCAHTIRSANNPHAQAQHTRSIEPTQPNNNV